MKRIALIPAVICLLCAGELPAATLLYCPFDSLQGWAVRSVGAAGAALVEPDGQTRHVRLTSSRGTVFLSRELPLDAVRGTRVTVTCSVRSERIIRGPQLSSTGKLQLAVQTPRGIEHSYARFVGTEGWHEEAFTADVPDDAQRVVLNLGLESCHGLASFDRLLVKNDRRGVHQLDLSGVANAGHDQLGFDVFPEEPVEWKDVPFRLIDGSKLHGLDCLRLKGIEHDDWPASTASPIEVHSTATAIYILHAAPAGRSSSDSPCTIWNAKFVDGHTSTFSVFEGRDIGAAGATDDLENWHVAWRQKNAAGQSVSLGVTKWVVYNLAVIESISCQSYQGASPVILAVTVVEDPPQPEQDFYELDDGSGFQ